MEAKAKKSDVSKPKKKRKDTTPTHPKTPPKEAKGIKTRKAMEAYLMKKMRISSMNACGHKASLKALQKMTDLNIVKDDFEGQSQMWQMIIEDKRRKIGEERDEEMNDLETLVSMKTKDF